MHILELLLLAGTLFLIYKTFILTRNRFDLAGLPPRADFTSKKSIAICIPARNEERNIEKCVSYALDQTYNNYHIYVLNDRSTDDTGKILNTLQKSNPEKLTIINGTDKPEGWLGKPHACHILAQQTNEDYLLFTDADTWMQPHALKSMVFEMELRGLSFLTVWPQQQLYSFWENIIVPLVYDALLGLLPTAYTERKPLWMPTFLYNKLGYQFAAANGQCVMFTRESYHSIGGHKAVKNDIVEDVKMAQLIKKQGLPMKMYHGAGSFFCRMYANYQEIFDGFRKNFFAGFNYNYALFTLMAIIHILAYILPVGVLIGGLIYPFPLYVLIPAFINVGLMVMHHVVLATWFRWPPGFSFLKPLGVLWFQYLGIISVMDRIFKKKVNWKGDKV